MANTIATITPPQGSMALVPSSGTPALANRPAPMSFAEKVKMADLLSQSDMLPKFQGKPGNVLLAIELACALRINVAVALMNIHVIEGKASASSALVSSLVRMAGHKMRISGDDKAATVTIIRWDDPTFEYKSVWTIDRARIAGLLDKKGDTWKKYPAAMLKARAITECARDACQEALCGVQYTPEELGAEVGADEQPVKAPEGARKVTIKDAPAMADAMEADFTVTESAPPIPPVDQTKAYKMLVGIAQKKFSKAADFSAWVAANADGRTPDTVTEADCHRLYGIIADELSKVPKQDAQEPTDDRKAAKAAWYAAMTGRLDEHTAFWWGCRDYGFVQSDDTLATTLVPNIITATRALLDMSEHDIALVLDDHRAAMMGDA